MYIEVRGWTWGGGGGGRGGGGWGGVQGEAGGLEDQEPGEEHPQDLPGGLYQQETQRQGSRNIYCRLGRFILQQKHDFQMWPEKGAFLLVFKVLFFKKSQKA